MPWFITVKLNVTVSPTVKGLAPMCFLTIAKSKVPGAGAGNNSIGSLSLSSSSVKSVFRPLFGVESMSVGGVFVLSRSLSALLISAEFNSRLPVKLSFIFITINAFMPPPTGTGPAKVCLAVFPVTAQPFPATSVIPAGM